MANHSVADSSAHDNPAPSAYRVTAFNPNTNEEFNVGVFLAVDREDAIRQATERDAENTKHLVLDAAPIQQAEV